MDLSQPAAFYRKKVGKKCFRQGENSKNHMARPKLNDGEKRDTDVCVALNAREFEIISTKAKRSKNRIAVYLRRAGLSDETLKVVPEINQSVAGQLREMQHLLSQFSMLLEEHQINIIDPIFFVELQKELRQMHSDFLNLCQRPK